MGKWFIDMKKGIRAEIIYFDAPYDYYKNNINDCLKHYNDGLLIFDKGKILDSGDFGEIADKYENIEIIDKRGSLILPGLIDLHTHYPQREAMASINKGLLTWLDKYIFPTEQKYKDSSYSRIEAREFIKNLIDVGTTTAAVYCASFKESAEVLFQESSKINMNIIAGQVLMDRNAPKELLIEHKKAYDECEELIGKWHKNRRQLYALTPRFGISCTNDMLDACSKLSQKYDDIIIQTHIAETVKECQRTKELFPHKRDYLEVYEYYNLIGSRTLLGHGVYLSEDELLRISKKKSSIVHCPGSNLFLGSGLFKMKDKLDMGINLSIASDVGAGTSISLFDNLSDAYKIQQLQKFSLTPFLSLYLVTYGAAKSICQEDKIGSLQVKSDADFIVITPKNSILRKKLSSISQSKNFEKLEEVLFACFTLIRREDIEETYICGVSIKEQIT